MALPTYEEAMLPVLEVLQNGSSRHRREIVSAVTELVGLTESEREQTLPSGKATVILSRVAWALAYLKQARLVESSKRGIYEISDRGRNVLNEKPTHIDGEFLSRFPEFVEFLQRARASSGNSVSSGDSDKVLSPQPSDQNFPEEALEAAYAKLRTSLEEEVIEAVKGASPAFFESLVIDLLVKMGYGGSRPEAARSVGRGMGALMA